MFHANREHSARTGRFCSGLQKTLVKKKNIKEEIQKLKQESLLQQKFERAVPMMQNALYNWSMTQFIFKNLDTRYKDYCSTYNLVEHGRAEQARRTNLSVDSRPPANYPPKGYHVCTKVHTVILLACKPLQIKQ
jgi:hypothetical protein